METTLEDKWTGRGTFCRTTYTTKTCLPSFIDALCIVSIIFLVISSTLSILLIYHTIKAENIRFSLIDLLFVASVLHLTLLPQNRTTTGYKFSFQLMWFHVSFLNWCCPLVKFDFVKLFEQNHRARLPIIQKNHCCTWVVVL